MYLPRILATFIKERSNPQYMVEAIGVPIRETESQVRYPNLRFEPGDHGPNGGTPAGEVQRKAFYNRYTQGDPYVHPWNTALIERIRETKPKIMAIDGVGFALKFVKEDNEAPTLIPAKSDEVWLSLPTTPEQINSEGSILVVDGDPVNLSVPFGFSNNNGMQALESALANKLGNDGATESKVLPASLFIAGVIDAAIVANIVKSSKKEGKALSRRTFLKGASELGLTAAASAYSYGGLDVPSLLTKATDSTTEAGKDRWLDVVDFVDLDVMSSKFEKMRTAAQILKTKDAIDYMNLPKEVSSSVIMGFNHSIDAAAYMNNDVAAQDTIGDYLHTVDPVITEVLRKYPTLSRKSVVDKIKSYLSQTFVHKVDQPNPQSFFTQDFPDAVNSATTTVAGFHSKRVEAALADFS